MTVSQKHQGHGIGLRGTGSAPSEGLLWLHRELQWEQVLTRLRVAAGVLPAEARSAVTDEAEAPAA